MNSTLATLADTVVRNVGRPDKLQVAKEELNNALKAVFMERPWRDYWIDDTVSFAAGDTSVALANDALTIIEARCILPLAPAMSYPIMLMRKPEFMKLFPNVPDQSIHGRPVITWLDGTTLRFDRISDGQYNIEYTYMPLSELLGDTDVCLIPNSDEVLIAYATMKVYMSIEMYDNASVWKSEYGRNLMTLINFIQRQPANIDVARPWVRKRPVNPNPPWLDPWQGLAGAYGDQ